jgi:hypothetical protein
VETLEGLVYVKHGRIGTKSEGPDYYLEFFCRKFVEITGELDKETSIMKVTKVKEICVGHIPKKMEYS